MCHVLEREEMWGQLVQKERNKRTESSENKYVVCIFGIAQVYRQLEITNYKYGRYIRYR